MSIEIVIQFLSVIMLVSVWFTYPYQRVDRDGSRIRQPLFGSISQPTVSAIGLIIAGTAFIMMIVFWIYSYSQGVINKDLFPAGMLLLTVVVMQYYDMRYYDPLPSKEEKG